MEQTQNEDFVSNETKNVKAGKKEKFKARCYKCKEKEHLVSDNGISYDLPFAYVEIPKDKELIKECKEYVKESQNKYNNGRVIKRALYNGCSKCGNTINICCKDYVDFYSTGTNKSKQNKVAQ